ncbi:DUF3793 family protein [Clostridium sp. C2-6-12]|uniref:DUF3793 family protein n=1 Tax=Clostridium sp. C2-6-12 TaxID=2698832 RepID=UPI00136E53C1|nr:DUF3793 family protein [Clostridium sp. C2-6-12]
MKHLDFYRKLNSMDSKEYIETFLVYNLSLVIAGIKPAITLTIKTNNLKLYNSWNEFGIDFLQSSNLKFIELRKSDDSIIVMIYDELLLKKDLNEKSHKEFLFNMGYPKNACIDDCIKTLKARYEKYHCPHELGLFLGIPFKDVRDFMECTTKKCLLCGYWKVYNDSKKAKMIFTKYDKVKEYTIENLLEGNSSRDLALSIRNYFHKEAKYI